MSRITKTVYVEVPVKVRASNKAAFNEALKSLRRGHDVPNVSAWTTNGTGSYECVSRQTARVFDTKRQTANP